jgi:hypothetical protein
MRKKNLLQIAASALALATAWGCSNSVSLRTSTTSGGGTTATTGTNSGTSSTSAQDFTISNVTITAGSGGAFNTQIFFNTTVSTQQLTNVCNTNTANPAASKPCRCQFEWSEVNDSTGSSTPLNRRVTTAISTPQVASVTCPAPNVYGTEIPDGTTIRIKVIPFVGNSSSFSMNPFRFVKRPTGVSGAFRDVNGNLFDNILRYSCYETRARGMDVRTQKLLQSNPSGGSNATVLWASKFCVTKANNDGQDGGDLCDPTTAQISAQAYYYNLYIPDSRRGEIAPNNAGYTCPRVVESLRGGRGTTVVPDYWPLDSNFALSVTRTSDFRVGVIARSRLQDGGSASVDTTCSDGNSQSTPGSPVDGGGINTKCLGFAMKPASDGTCPAIQLADGSIRPTFRLRRFIALYPPFFDSDGKLLPEPQRTDQIYVLDRPVNAAGIDPRKPYTMRGPKPCPFAYFDHRGVTSDTSDPDYVDSSNPGDRRRRPGYVATSNPLWNGKNVDGIQYPNIDLTNVVSTPNAPNSCAAALPKFNRASGRFSLITPHATQNPIYKEVHIRPGQSWAPHYEEDTSFEACAPPASPYRDPPLHFSRDPSTGNVSWCAEAYPSQNPDVHNVDRSKGSTASDAMPGLVLNYTSHVVKNSSSNTCAHTQPDLSRLYAPIERYPYNPGTAANCPNTPGETDLIPGVAWHPQGMSVDSIDLLTSTSVNGCTVHNATTNPTCTSCLTSRCYYCANQTCDRTVAPQFTSISPELSRYPLLARARQVEEAIANDSTYSCMVSYDAGGGKTGKATPTGGCCGSTVRMDTGIYSGGTGTSAQRLFNRSAHLEPDVTCQVPTY